MEIRNYQAGDEKAILSLFELSFKKKLATEYWKWRFLDNPVAKPMIKLMWEGDTLAGHYAVSPVMLQVEGDLVLSALSMTTMTHPEHAGKGIFTKLAEALYQDEYAKQGLKVIWGFPNNNSHYGFVKNLQWKDLQQIPSFSLNLHDFKKAAVADFEVVESLNEDHAATAAQIAGKESWGVARSSQYLNWRYAQNPVNTYRFFEKKQEDQSYFAVVKVFPSFSERGKTEVDILELAVPADVTVLQELLVSILEELADPNLIRINCWMPLHDSRHIALEKIGFVNNLPITYSGFRVMDPSLNKLAPSNWNYSMGDSDIY